ncbi:MAG: aspartate carbamoyltransferase [Clostridia bacterium]|nr:aspartate carbamoyltransferase [Clostridia bacterium]
MLPTDFLDESHLNEADWEDLYGLARQIHRDPAAFSDAAKGKILGTLFYEPSTRTRLSFETAMLRLGGEVIGFADPSSSSVVKGETLKDTIKIVSSYCDVLALRTPLEGGPHAASLFSSVPVINAGDGSHLHPTQTLTDLFCIRHRAGTLTGLVVGFCGDLKNGRTVHSLSKSLARRGCTFYCISDPALKLPEHLKKELVLSGAKVYECTALDDCIEKLDVLYMTRTQRERGSDVEQTDALRLTADKMARARREMLVLHPLPKVDEIAPEVDDDPRALYFAQAKGGVSVRMALILRLLERPYVEKRVPFSHEKRRCTNPRCVTAFEPGLFPDTDTAHEHLVCAYCSHPIA